MEKSRVLTDPICLIVILLFFNVLLTAAEGKHTQPKSIKVSLRAKWSSTPLLLEAGELLANEQKDLYWEFVKKWTESDHHLASSKECFQQILDYGSYFLKDKLLSFFHFSLVLRSASPKLVLYRQLAQESLLSNPLFHKSEKNLSNFDSSIISASNPDLGRWSISENPHSPKGRCCWVDVGSILYDITELSTWIADSQELLKNTPEMEIYDFDHIYPISNRTGYRAILYAALGTKCFSAFHSALAAAAEKGKLQYILRPVLPSGCESDAEYCASVGSGSILNLSGYGVELALKNMEYKAIDDSVVKKGIVLEDPRTEDLTQEVRGFIFSRLLERKPAITADLMTFRDVLLSSTISETLDVWELKDLGHQTAQRIVQASDPFHAMQEINQNFPAVVSSLSRTKLDESIKDEIVANQRMVPPGKCLMAINGALINIESIDLFSLMAVVHGELSLADRIAAFKVPPKDIKALLYTTDSLEQTSFRLDFRSSHVHYLNNLEEDAAYRRWRSNINELLMPIFPGQFYYIRKNLFHAVYVLDPSSMRGLKVIDVIMYMYNNKVPMRFGIILFSSRLAKVFEENGDDSLKCSKSGEEKQQKYNDTAISIISLFYYIKEKYDTKTAFKFLYNLHSLWGVTKPHDDDLVELSYVEDAFLETTRAKGDSSPQEISLKLESESNIKDKACQSTVTVFKLGLSEIQPCLLMNGLVYGNIQAQEAALQAMNEELMRIQEGVYYRQIDSYTDILEKFLSENGHPRYNPYIINDGRDDQKFVSLAEWILRNNSVFTNLKYLHSPETSDDLKPVTHLLAVDLTSRGGLNLLLQGVRYLLDGSKRSRIAILYNVNDGFSILEDSPTTLLLKVIELSFSLGQNSKILPFLNDLLSWYEVNYLAGVDERKFDARMFVDDVYKLSEANDLKTERLKSALAEQSFSSLKIYLEKVSNFLSLEFGLMPGENAIITNGRVVLQNEHRFIRDDFKLLEAVEYERRIKPIVSVIEQVEWNGMDPDDLTSEFLSNALLGISSAMAIRSRSSDKAHFEILNAEHSAIIKEVENSFLHIDAVIDPLSSTGQKLAPLLRLLVKWFQPSARIVLNPVTSLADLPLKNFYRYVVPSEADIISDASSFDGPIAWFSNMPLSKTLTMNLDVPEPWLVEPVIAIHDLDNILLENLGVERTLAAVFELEALVLTGHCSEKDHDPPRGLQLILGTKKDPHMVDTLVMANLGYWQLKASPGIWSLSLAPGRSSELYTLEGPKEGTEEGPMTKKIVIDSFDPKSVHLQVVRKRGKENEKLLRDADGTSSDDLPKEEKKGWNNGFLKWASGLINSEEKQLPKNLKNSDVYDMNGRHGETIHIFSIASGHLYERFLKIMILSVLKNTNRPLKFWFIKNYLSPQFKDVIPHMAKKYGFEYELITYKWPTWLHKQTEKQRIIWAYKILFLDVIFPLSLKKVIFVDADQIVRADMGELYDMDIKGKPLAYTPFCDNNKEMDGYRFWKQGFWKDHLRGKPYHISALYVVDLEKFRQLAAGDTLRVFYETLSKDRNSLSNLDQDLPNYAQHTVPIFSLPQEWLWCESWCGNATKSKSKTIDLCNNPMTKEPKLQGARRIVAEWPSLDEEVRKFTATILGEEIEENMQDNETQNQLLKDSEEKQDLESLAEL